MKTFFDTSTLVQALVRSLDRHSRAAPWLDRALQGEFEWVVATHTLAELYAVLTALPVSPRITPSEARRLIAENIEGHATIVPLTARDYTQVIGQLAEAGMTRGHHLRCAGVPGGPESGARRLLTFNVAHFQRTWPEGAAIIQTP